MHFQPDSSLTESTSASLAKLDVESTPVDTGLFPDHENDSPNVEDDLDLSS